MFDLKPVNQYKLQDSPIAQVLGQIRFPMIARLQTAEGIAALQEVLSGDYPYMDRVAETTFAVPSSGPIDFKSEESVSWHFTDDDGRLIVVGAHVVTLSVAKQYEGIDEFVDRFAAVVRALQQVFRIRRFDRLAIRFLDLVPDIPSDGTTWVDWFREDVVGWAASPLVTESTRLHSTVAQTHLISSPEGELSRFPADVQAVVRHGVVPKGTVLSGIPPMIPEDRSFLLDMDIFVASPQGFDVDVILDQLRSLHSQADRFFRWTITLEGEKRFGLLELT